MIDPMPLWLIRAAPPALTVARGFIANINAVVTERQVRGAAAYAAS